METAFTSPGHWYRGNLHMHSTESDGKLGPQEALTWYRERGYDFASLTDHRKTTDVSTFGDEGFLVIPGTELDCVDPERDVGYHIVGVGIKPFSQDDATRQGPGQALVDLITRHDGLAIMAHPYWLGQEPSDIMAVSGAVAVEVYNATCARPGKEFAMVHWDGLLDRGYRIWGVAADDAHNYVGDAGRGWVMVKAPELTEAAIRQALIEGRFYATQGPAIVDMRLVGDRIEVHSSPVQKIRFISNRGRGRTVEAEPGGAITAASFPAPPRGYVRVECIDHRGLRAWSQPLFFD
ncbi:MAG: CehA/McbA family metallohydrolase [Firmicutes bacterium]|jgi:hypothetical protein|nr:CehA/McbA family metallohydrolase [Bacillota bacterium]